MYNDIGGKIKGLATATFIVETLSAIITGIYLMIDIDFLIGLAVLVGGPLVAWASSWLLYGFGELIDNSEAIKWNTAKIASNTSNENQKTEAKPKKQMTNVEIRQELQVLDDQLEFGLITEDEYKVRKAALMKKL